MFRTTGVDATITNPVDVGKDNIVDRIGNNEVNRAKVGTIIAKSKTQDKIKDKNLAKFKALA